MTKGWDWDHFSKIRKDELGRKWEEMRKRREGRVRKFYNIPDIFEGIHLGNKDLNCLYGISDRKHMLEF